MYGAPGEACFTSLSDDDPSATGALERTFGPCVGLCGGCKALLSGHSGGGWTDAAVFTGSCPGCVGRLLCDASQRRALFAELSRFVTCIRLIASNPSTLLDSNLCFGKT